VVLLSSDVGIGFGSASASMGIMPGRTSCLRSSPRTTVVLVLVRVKSCPFHEVHVVSVSEEEAF
jgi:hypothetical protein